jgi:acyl-CoA synthetase (AMP-forming)/AMP-acid ligase II
VNLAHLVDGHPEAAPAVVDEEGTVTTNGTLRGVTDRLRARLVGAGVTPDSRVALVAANSPAFVAAYLAELGAGAVAVPLNPASPVAEPRRQLVSADVTAVCAGPGGGHAAEAARLAAGDVGRNQRVAVVDIRAAGDRVSGVLA